MNVYFSHFSPSYSAWMTCSLAADKQLQYYNDIQPPPHGSYYTGENRTEMWGAFLVCVECLLLSIAASFLYKTSDYDAAHPASIG